MTIKLSAFFFIFCTTFFLIPVTALAQFYTPTPTDWDLLIQNARGAAGAGLFVMALVICQGLFLLFRTALGDLLGFHKLLILAGLSVVVTVGTKLLHGEPWQTVFTDAPTLMAFQVLIDQWMKHQNRWRTARNEVPGTLPTADVDSDSDSGLPK